MEPWQLRNLTPYVIDANAPMREVKKLTIKAGRSMLEENALSVDIATTTRSTEGAETHPCTDLRFHDDVLLKASVDVYKKPRISHVLLFFFFFIIIIQYHQTSSIQAFHQHLNLLNVSSNFQSYSKNHQTIKWRASSSSSLPPSLSASSALLIPICHRWPRAKSAITPASAAERTLASANTTATDMMVSNTCRSVVGSGSDAAASPRLRWSRYIAISSSWIAMLTRY